MNTRQEADAAAETNVADGLYVIGHAIDRLADATLEVAKKLDLIAFDELTGNGLTGVRHALEAIALTIGRLGPEATRP